MDAFIMECGNGTETIDPKVYFTNQDKQNLFRLKHTTPFKFCGMNLHTQFRPLQV